LSVPVKISVTIPTFNRAHLLRQAIDSVLDQTYRNFEIIVIDDGSTDGTRALVAQYGDKVRYFEQPNGGLGVARNAGLDRATGDCIAFLDSDDFWYPFKLDLQAQLLARLPDVGFVFSEFDILKDDGRVVSQGSRTWLAGEKRWEEFYSRTASSRSLGVQTPAVPAFQVYVGNLYRQFMNEAFVLPTTALVRREAIGALRFTERMRIFEDWEFFSRLAKHHAGAFADIATAVNRGHDDPQRLTRSSPLVKAQRYRHMVERVWKADPEFRSRYADAIRQVESASSLAVARSALLASEPRIAREALQGWMRTQHGAMAVEALAVTVLSRLPGGRHILRAGLLGKKLTRRLRLGSHYGSSQVNPAA
jgi:glycosyltransferase involved in cell wall biosynthesis